MVSDACRPREEGPGQVPPRHGRAGSPRGGRLRARRPEPTYHGEFWILAEREGDGIKSVSLELLGKTRELAAFLGEKVGVVLPCDDAGDLPAELIAHGADVVYAIEHPALAAFSPDPVQDARSRRSSASATRR